MAATTSLTLARPDVVILNPAPGKIVQYGAAKYYFYWAVCYASVQDSSLTR